MKKIIVKWFLIGLVLRLVIMPLTIHPDIRALDFGAFLISQKAQWLTFYDYFSTLEKNSHLVNIYGLDLFIYPPLAYLTPALFMFILGPFYNFSANMIFLNNMESIFGTIEIFRIAFLLKLPYLLFDFLVAYLLLKIFKEKGLTAFKLWMFNPLTLYATFAMGQFDIIPLLLIVASIFFALQKRKWLAVIMLGLGGAYKVFPLLFLPIFVLLFDKNFWFRLKLLALGLFSYLIFVVPYFLFSPMYRQAAFLAHQTEKMFFMKLPLSGAEYLSVFAIGYSLLLIVAARAKSHQENFWRFGFLLMLLFFSITHYHPQWFLWITPFLIWELVTYRFKNLWLVIILFASWLVITFLFEPSLSIGLFSPLWPQLSQAPDLSALLSRYFDVFQFKSLVRSLFAGTAIYFVLQLFLPRLKNEN